MLISCQRDEDMPPIPTMGGTDFLNISDFMIQLDADFLKNGESGVWRILSGEVDDKVYLENKNDPKTIFHGLPGEDYQLIWEVLRTGKSFTDTIIVSFSPLTTEIVIGLEDFYQTRMELMAKSYDRGEWTIEGDYHHIWRNVHGGTYIPDEKSPNIMFYGLENTYNKLTWTTWYGSKSASATVEFNGGTYQQGEALQDLQILYEPHTYKKNANGDISEINMNGDPRAHMFADLDLYPALQALKHLKKLQLMGDGFHVFPEVITSDYLKLEYLDLSINFINSVPDNFGNLVELDTLILSHNGIESLPTSFGNLKEVKYLDLFGLKLTSLPESFGNLSKLNYLILGHNYLTNLPESFGNLKNLERLDGPILSQSVPNSFSNLSNLKICDLWVEHGTAVLPEDFGRLTSLVSLTLRGDYKRLPDSFTNLANLEILQIAGGTGISEIPAQIGDLLNLKHLKLDVKTDKLPESITKLSNLVQLSLYGQLNYLPSDIDKLSNLKGITAGYLGLKEIPESIGNLKKLTSFSVAANDISSIPESIGGLSSIQSLYLGRNQITYFPASMANLSGTLRELFVNGNKYSDDELLKLKKMLPNTEIITYQSGD